jgi:hypothetical protein
VAGIGNLAPHVSVNGQVSVPRFRPCLRIREHVQILIERDCTTWDTGHRWEDNIEMNLSDIVLYHRILLHVTYLFIL